MHEISEEWTQPQWFVLFVRSNQEKRVTSGLIHRGIEHFLPCYESVRQWKDRRVKLQIPLFSGYVFVRLPLAKRVAALSVPNVVSLVGPRNCPSPISEEEISWIRKGVEHGKAMPWAELSAGESVIITAGVLSGLEGVLIRRQAGARVVISIRAIARSFVVEVDEALVRPVRPRCFGSDRQHPPFGHSQAQSANFAAVAHIR